MSAFSEILGISKAQLDFVQSALSGETTLPTIPSARETQIIVTAPLRTRRVATNRVTSTDGLPRGLKGNNGRPTGTKRSRL